MAGAAPRTDLTRNRVKVTETSSAHVMSTDHNGKAGCGLGESEGMQTVRNSLEETRKGP